MGSSGYGKVLKEERQYLWMILANLISRFGDSIDAIAYSWLVYGITGSKAWLALTFGINMIPTILLQPFGGALTEFFDKKKAVVLCDMARGIIVCFTAVLYLLGILRPWQLLALTFFNSCFEALRVPNGLALIPHILKSENYKTGISLNQAVSRMSELVGLGAAGGVIAWLGNGGALFIDAVTFFASGCLLSLLKISGPKTSGEKFCFGKYAASLKEGAVYFKGSRAVLTITFICIVLNVVLIPIENFQAAYVNELLKLGVSAMSVGSTALTIGTISGAFLFPKISKFLSDKRLLFYGGIVIGFLYFVYVWIGGLKGIEQRYIGYFLSAFTFGFFNSLIGVAVQVTFMTRVPENLIGRIGGIFTALACSSIPAASFILAGAALFFSVSQIYIFMGGLTMITFCVIWYSMSLRENNLSDS